MTRAALEAAGERLLAVLARMNQPSSWNGYAGLAMAFGLSNAQWLRDSVILAALCALIGVWRDDGTPAPQGGAGA